MKKYVVKRFLALTLALAATASLAACSSANNNTNSSAANSSISAEQKQSITITSLNANKEEVQVEVPYDAQRIAILDMPSLDILDKLGLGDRVVGTADTSIEYLTEYVDTTENLGTIKEADLEAIMSVEPDIIFIGGRLAGSYDALSEIAPVVFLSTDTELGVVESVRKNATTIASIFGKESEVETLMADFDERIAKLNEFAKGKNAVIGMCTSGAFNTLGNDGRLSIIGKEIGFTNIASEDVTSTHGNESSFELLVDLNPEYMFILDRDAAISTEGAKLAQEIMDNELVAKTDAYKNDNIIYLAHPSIWYTAEGGITALDYMLSDLESELL